MSKSVNRKLWVVALGGLPVGVVLAPAAEATAFPPAGTDTFETKTDMVIEFDASADCPAGEYQTVISGPVTITRDDPSGAGLNTVNMTIDSITFSGTAHGIGVVDFALAPSPASTGVATSVNGDGMFPANTALTLNYIMTTPCGVYSGTHVLTAVIDNFPPAATNLYSGAPSPFDEDSPSVVVGAGMLTTNVHQRGTLKFESGSTSLVPAMSTIGMTVLGIGVILMAIFMIWRRRTSSGSTPA